MVVKWRKRFLEQPDWRLDFKPNNGPVQQLLRVIVGTGLVALAASGLLSPFWATAMVLLGVFNYTEAAARY